MVNLLVQNWAEQDQRVGRNPIAKLEKPARDSEKKGILEPEQFVHLIKTTFQRNDLLGKTTGQERAVPYALAGCTGLRRKELLNIRWADINLSADNAYVRVNACLAKNSKEAIQPVPAIVVSPLRVLKAATRPNDYGGVYPSATGLTRQSFCETIWRGQELKP